MMYGKVVVLMWSGFSYAIVDWYGCPKTFSFGAK